MPKIKRIKKARQFSTPDGIWTIFPDRNGGIRIELCRPGEENLTHPEGNLILAYLYSNKTGEGAVSAEMFHLSRAQRE